MAPQPVAVNAEAAAAGGNTPSLAVLLLLLVLTALKPGIFPWGAAISRGDAAVRRCCWRGEKYVCVSISTGTVYSSSKRKER